MNRFAAYLRENPLLDMWPDAAIARAERLDVAVESKASPSLVSAARRGTIAVVNIHGAIAHHASAVDGWNWDTSYEHIQSAFDAAISDSAVGGVVLSINSPGGSHAGMSELSDHIRASRGSKPIAAYVDGMAASAGYGLAVAADKIYVAPSALVGSIGTYVMHADVSKAAENAGYKFTFVHAGRFKVDGNPFESLSDTARAEMQSIVDHGYGQFVDVVAAGRGVTPAAVRGPEFGEGKLFTSDEAKRRGLVDGIKTQPEFWAALGASDTGQVDRRRRSLDLKLRECNHG